MPITTDVRKYGETVLEQSKVALDEARKPWFAAVGAGELAYGQLTQLPTEVQARLRKLQAEAGNLDPKDAVQTATGKALGAYGSYAARAQETYESLAHRGELVVRRLRRSDEVKSAFDKAEEIVGSAGDTVAAAEETVTKPGRPVTRKPATPRATATTARKAPAKRTAKS
jgi:heparin binding hemagglutinin HbhA